MKLKAVIEVILNTPALAGKRLYLAALVARDGQADAVAEIAAFWIGQGGTVDDLNAD